MDLKSTPLNYLGVVKLSEDDYSLIDIEYTTISTK